MFDKLGVCVITRNLYKPSAAGVASKSEFSLSSSPFRIKHVMFALRVKADFGKSVVHIDYTHVSNNTDPCLGGE